MRGSGVWSGWCWSPAGPLFGILGGNEVFLAVMVVATILLGGGVWVLLGEPPEKQNDGKAGVEPRKQAQESPTEPPG